jgi:hypothetical protein
MCVYSTKRWCYSTRRLCRLHRDGAELPANLVVAREGSGLTGEPDGQALLDEPDSDIAAVADEVMTAGSTTM